MRIIFETEIRIVPVILVTCVTDDFGNEVSLPMSDEIDYRAYPIRRAREFIEEGEVH
ncbi:hypothetical protein [Paraburkholderia terrae]|uniref:hypothetical protein n=1 Tax=Paraburkholderia terrae TaxID=311230 RepID=UPI002055EA54|nr:hypothetical protein [Paraburkholderia terrae]BDC37723.1 hypothetical protein PTKU15_10200 [Paraburkholderia terrae]